jgi:signal transduction histidine kinase
MGKERIDLQAFLGESLEELGPTIPDRVVFTCQLIETPPAHVDPAELRAVLATLITNACAAGDEVRLRIGTVAGKSGPHAFVEVSRPDAGNRLIVPVPVFRREMQLAAASAPSTLKAPRL